jgi:hypothetical protein
MAVSSSATSTRLGMAFGGRLNRFIFVLALLPMVLVAAIINRYGVNVPYGDEWSLLSLVGKWDSHQLNFADLFAEHNGHRILIPRLIYLAMIQLTHGNTKPEMFFSLFLCILTSTGLFILLRRTVRGSTAKHLALWAFINLFLFSPIQAENWLWGFQLQIFLSNLCLVGAIVCATSEAPRLVRLAGALAFAVAGTFSFGNGLLIWPVILFLLVCRREKLLFLIAWVSAAALVVLAYLPGYQGHDAVRPVVSWLDYPLYFFGFLGAPLARIPNSQPLTLPVIIGSILVVLFLGIAVEVVRRRGVLGNAAPWLALGANAIGSAVMATTARSHLGPEHALDSRYTTVAVILLVSLIGLVASVISRERTSAPSHSENTIVISSALVGSLLALHAVNAPSEFDYIRMNHDFRARGKSALQFSAILDVDKMIRATLLIREDPDTLSRYLTVLDRLQLSDPPRRQSLTLSDAEDQPQRSSDEYGIFESLQYEGPEALVATGWSYLPDDSRRPACVVMAHRTGPDWTAFALSELTERRPDLVTKYKSRDFVERGWRYKFSRTALPPGAEEISAWAFDAHRGRTYRLPGSFRLQR